MRTLQEQLQPLQEQKAKLTPEQQIAAIRDIMSRPEPREVISVPQYRFSFGKHRHETLEYVFIHDVDYLLWCYHSDVRFPDRVIRFLEEEVLSETTAEIQ